MFTGIVEEIGEVLSARWGAGGLQLELRAPLCASDASLGDSISVSGVCLTVVARTADTLAFEAAPETLRVTSLGGLRRGSRVNLERSLLASGRLGGHFVQGHVEAAGRLESLSPEGLAWILAIRIPEALDRYIVPKGSVAVDGISLTVVEANGGRFTVSIIPHTWKHTTLSDRRPGDALNIETDILARYAEKLLRTGGEASTLTQERLAAAGFV